MPGTGWDQRPVCILSLRKLSLFLVMPQGLWDLISPTRDYTRALSSESMGSKPLGHQGIP